MKFSFISVEKTITLKYNIDFFFFFLREIAKRFLFVVESGEFYFYLLVLLRTLQEMNLHFCFFFFEIVMKMNIY